MYLPSEVARLVLGYLRDVNCLDAYDVFLNTSPDLVECRKMKVKNFSTEMRGPNLVQILEEYNSTYSLVREQLSKIAPDYPGNLRQELTYLLANVIAPSHRTSMQSITPPSAVPLSQPVLSPSSAVLSPLTVPPPSTVPPPRVARGPGGGTRGAWHPLRARRAREVRCAGPHGAGVEHGRRYCRRRCPAWAVPNRRRIRAKDVVVVGSAENIDTSRLEGMRTDTINGQLDKAQPPASSPPPSPPPSPSQQHRKQRQQQQRQQRQQPSQPLPLQQRQQLFEDELMDLTMVDSGVMTDTNGYCKRKVADEPGTRPTPADKRNKQDMGHASLQEINLDKFRAQLFSIP